MKTYTGSCHCGKITFTATGAFEQVLDCNCSHCSRKGMLLAFIPRAEFTLITGEDNLTEYRFNKKHIAHLFCTTCGVQSFGYGTSPDGAEMVAVNVRTLEEIDLDTLTIKKVDGKSY